MVGFLDDDPIVYRTLGMSKPFQDSKERSKELVKTSLKDSDFVKFVGKNEDKLALRLDIYSGKYDDASIDEITETPFEKFFLATLGLFDPDEVMLKFQGDLYTVTELNKLFEEKNYSVSGSGAVYSKDEQGLIPAYLEYLFKTRKTVKKEMLKHYHDGMVLKKFKQACIDDGLYKED